VTDPDPWRRLPASALQNVWVTGGFGYGTIGADLHVLAHRGPVYVLSEYRRRAAARDTEWLLAQPSRLLNAAFEIVEFTGREEELARLTGWRDAASPRLSATWLHAPGGQGKTRLAAEFSARSAAAGYKVVTVTHGPGSVLEPPGSQDLRPGDAAGLLLVIDYADRWPVSHLALLFGNVLLRQPLPTRLLLLARSPQPWPAVRACLEDLSADTHEQFLPPLPGGARSEPREHMYTVARDCFAALYGITDPGVIAVPATLERPEFGLVLTVQMAALVAVDAHHRRAAAPVDGPGALSAYLLGREQQYWQLLYERGKDGLDFTTRPQTMARTVFTAALTGATDHPRGVAVLRAVHRQQCLGDQSLGGLDADQLLADHARCYPPADAATVLEPMYPDRLAEDFLALSLPGHTVGSHVPAPWAGSLLEAVTARAPDGSPPAHIARAVTMLASAAVPDRWPHVAPYLSGILRADPALALAAGGPALATLAGVTGLDTAVLQAVADLFPRRDVDLDLGMAALSRRLTGRLLAEEPLAARRGLLHYYLGERLGNAGRHAEALAAAQEAVAVFRPLAASDPFHLPGLAMSLNQLGIRLAAVGRRAEAAAPAEESLNLFRRLAASDSGYLPELANALSNAGSRLFDEGRYEAALVPAAEAVTLYQRLAKPDEGGGRHLGDLAIALDNYANSLTALERHEESLAPSESATRIHAELAAQAPGTHLPELARALNNLAGRLYHLGRHEDALARNEEALDITQRLAEANPAVYQRDLWGVLTGLSIFQARAGRPEAALAAAQEALELARSMAAAAPAAHEPDLVAALRNSFARLGEVGQYADAVEHAREAAPILRRLAASNPQVHVPDLAQLLEKAGVFLSYLGRLPEAVSFMEEAITLWRGLVAGDRAAHRLRLAMALDILGTFLAKLPGRLADAVTVIEAAIALYEEATRAGATDHMAYYAGTLNNLSTIVTHLGRHDDALELSRRAVVLCRELVVAGSVDVGAYVTALKNFADVRATPGRELADALAAVTEALRIRDELLPDDARQSAAGQDPLTLTKTRVLVAAALRTHGEGPPMK